MHETVVFLEANLHPVACRRFCVSQRAEGLAAILSSVAAAVQQVAAQQTMLLETLDAVLVRPTIPLHHSVMPWYQH